MIRLLSLLCIGLCVPVGLVLAQVDTDQFTISFYGGADSQPPTTPVITSVVPASDTQIDIVWGASTDDIALGGYVVFRDGSAIATTTLTNYSDTGLLASTTYSYIIQAFDGARNYSSSSAPVATTTLETPPDPPPSSGQTGGGTIARPLLDTLTVTPGFSTSSIALTTVTPNRVEIRWGQTTAYELGASIGSIYTRNHSLLITDLTPGTIYYYEITATTPSGSSAILRAGQFTTLGNITSILPANVEQFTAVERNDDVLLSWVPPTTVDNATIRIVRNYFGFPSFPTDGAVVYQGTGASFIDIDALANRSPAYYTAFVYDQAGNVSSGAIAMAFTTTPSLPIGSGNPANTTPPTLPTDIFTGTPTSSTSAASSATPPAVVPRLDEIFVTQNDRRFSFAEADITLDAFSSFTLTIPKEAVGGSFKSIIGTIVDPTDTRQEFSFLLRINKDQTAYEAVIAPVGVLGASTFSVTIYNYQSLQLARYQTPVTFSAERYLDKGIQGNVSVCDGWWFWSICWPWWVPYAIAVVLFLYLVLRTRMNEKREDN